MKARSVTLAGSVVACGPGEACERPRADRIGKITLWIAAVVAFLATAFPWYAQYLPL